MSIITDENKIDAVLERSVDTIYPDKDTLKEKLLSGEQLRIYAGVDATGPRLHLGHAINYLMLRRFHELGHKIIVLIGDFTAKIGDPSDKSAARTQLSEAEVEKNLAGFRQQIGKILDLNNEDNPIEFKRNSEWLHNLNYEDVIKHASNFTVQQMVERDVFRRRLDEEKPLYVHEFFYPLMQGYDTVALRADVEIGGTDQMFNMLAGRTLRKRLKNKEKFVITHPLLEDPNTGEMLMSKSEERGVFLNDGSKEIFAQIMRIPDSGIIQFFTHCTDLPLAEIKAYEKQLSSGANPRDVKLELAKEVAALLYPGDREESLSAAEAAKNTFITTFSNQETPDDVNEVPATSGDKLIDIFTEAEVVPSKSQFRRLVDQGAVTNTDTDEKITDHNTSVAATTTFKVGKHRFIKVVI